MKTLKLKPEAKLRWKDYLKFSHKMLETKDIDPVYPVLQELNKGLMMDEQEFWLSFLYVAWYNLPVGLTAYTKCPEPDLRILPKIDWSWPTGIERRANRGGKVVFHIESYLKTVAEYGDQYVFYTKDLDFSKQADPEQNWRIINTRLQTLHLNGRWAAYKHCEILRRVHGLPILAPDMGNAFSSGPRQGLALFYGEVEGNSPAAIELLDEQALDLQARMAKWGVEVDIEELETLMCNWKSLVNGKYYIGHDIDELLEQMHVGQERGWLSTINQAVLEKARRDSLPNEYLGEIRGWHGVDRRRMRAYKDRGRLLIRRRPDA